jgi:hypothetical protein
MIQTAVAVVLVVACAVYATWKLLPAAARRGIARGLLQQPMPEFGARFFRRHAEAASGCGCDGCDRNVAATPPAAGKPPSEGAPLVFHPRRKG